MNILEETIRKTAIEVIDNRKATRLSSFCVCLESKTERKIKVRLHCDDGQPHALTVKIDGIDVARIADKETLDAAFTAFNRRTVLDMADIVNEVKSEAA